MFKKLFSTLLQPSTNYSVLSILVLGIIVGSVIFTGSAVIVSSTGSVEFCLSCHVMQKAYEEYSASNHAANTSGVVATCADCHLPHDYPNKLFVKASRITEVWGFMTGVIDTAEKYESNRLAMAQSVWNEFEGNQSAPCRGCHQFDKMVASRQKPHAAKAHQRAVRNRTTCVVCHLGIAHNLPKLPLPDKARPKSAGTAVYCQGCHENLRAVLPENHPIIEKGSLNKCVQCHVPGSRPADDTNNFYAYMHYSHKQRIECTGCHLVTREGFRLLVNASEGNHGKGGAPQSANENHKSN